MNFKWLIPVALGMVCGSIQTVQAQNASDPYVGKDIAPVALGSSQGGTVNVPKDFKGKWTLLYFYPKDGTPGCTKQACSYRDKIEDFKKLGVALYGVSVDDLASHSDFTAKNHLNFPLLSDSKHELGQGLGVYANGHTSRDTFLINPQGKVQVVWRAVDPSITQAETYAEIAKRVGKH